MKIRTQFTITVVLFGAILIAVAASLLLTNLQMERIQKQEDIAHKLELGARELSYLSNDYLLHGESHQRARWEAKYASFSKLLSGFGLQDPKIASVVKNIKANQERLKAIFIDVASTIENGPSADSAAADIARIRVSWSRMEIQNQGMAFDSSRLARLLEEQLDRLRHRRFILLFALIGLFGAFLVINYVAVNRRILRGISHLQTGARIIGSGNLEFAIEERTADEIGDLSRAFNRMTSDLRAVTASKADLEREMNERRQAEAALKKSETKYRNLFENMVEEVHFWQVVRDEAGGIKTWRLVDANPPTLKTWGRKKVEEIRGRTTDEIFGPGATEHYMPVVQKIMSEGVSYSFEDYFPNLDRYFRFTSVPLGEYFITTGADITGIKKAEENLRRSSQFPEENPNPVLRCTPAGRILYANAPARHWMATLGWQDGGALPIPVGKAMAEARGQDHAVQAEITNPAGRTFGFSAMQPSGEDYINLYGMDLTERKQVEEALKLREAHYRDLVQNANSAIVRWKADGTLTFFNEYARQFFGYETDEVIGSDVRILLPERDSSGYDLTGLVHDIVAHPDRFVNNVNENVCRDGRRVWMTWTNKAILDDNGQLSEILAVGTDITEQKRAQEALERSNQELEQFAYVASHDLQEPLRAIVGFLQLLQNRYGDQIDEKGRHFIERSVKAGRRMQTLIRELLTLSRVLTKGAAFETADLNHVFKDVLDNLQSIIQEKNANITCAELPNLTIDASQIKRLFQNLIMNAVRYNESPVPVIDVGCQEHDHTYHFYVKDNGIGISPQFYQRIFMLFQRLHTDREYPGTGLGLALCKKIVERHGGTIWVKSQPQGGSIFYFSLPKQR